MYALFYNNAFIFKGTMDDLKRYISNDTNGLELDKIEVYELTPIQVGAR